MSAQTTCPRCGTPAADPTTHDDLECAVNVVVAYLDHTGRDDLAAEVAVATDRRSLEERIATAVQIARAVARATDDDAG